MPRGANNGCHSYRFLEGRLKELGICRSDLGYILNLSHTAISHRMTGRTAWNIDEMYKVLEICQARPEELHIYFPPKGTYFCGKSSSTAKKLPLYLTVEIEQPTSENLQISCSVQQYKIT